MAVLGGLTGMPLLCLQPTTQADHHLLTHTPTPNHPPHNPPSPVTLQAKTTKKITLRMECKECKYKHQQPIKRCKKFEIGAPKKSGKK